MHKSITIDGRDYHIETYIQDADSVGSNPNTTHILIPVFILDEKGLKLIEACVHSLKHFSNEGEIQIWVIDNNSPKEFSRRLVQSLGDRVNLLLNRTEPKNQLYKPKLITKVRQLVSGNSRLGHSQLFDGSYANGIGLEIGRACLPDTAQTILALHSDTCVFHPDWLSFMRSKLSPQTPAVGGYHDRVRINALHVSCLMLDNRWFKTTGESFMPNNRQERYPDRPVYDVGDSITWRLTADGLNSAILENTHNSPDLVEQIPEENPFKWMGNAPRVFNDNQEIIFIHLGRGTAKAAGIYNQHREFTLDDWLTETERYIQNNPYNPHT